MPWITIDGPMNSYRQEPPPSEECQRHAFPGVTLLSTPRCWRMQPVNHQQPASTMCTWSLTMLVTGYYWLLNEVVNHNNHFEQPLTNNQSTNPPATIPQPFSAKCRCESRTTLQFCWFSWVGIHTQINCFNPHSTHWGSNLDSKPVGARHGLPTKHVYNFITGLFMSWQCPLVI